MKNPKKSSAKASSVKLSPAQKAANTRKAKQIEMTTEIVDMANEILRLNDELYKLKNPAALKKETVAEKLKQEKMDIEKIFDDKIKEHQSEWDKIQKMWTEHSKNGKKIQEERNAAILEINRKIEYHNVDLKLELEIN